MRASTHFHLSLHPREAPEPQKCPLHYRQTGTQRSDLVEKAEKMNYGSSDTDKRETSCTHGAPTFPLPKKPLTYAYVDSAFFQLPSCHPAKPRNIQISRGTEGHNIIPNSFIWLSPRKLNEAAHRSMDIGKDNFNPPRHKSFQHTLVKGGRSYQQGKFFRRGQILF